MRAVSGARLSAPSNPAFLAASTSCRGRDELEIADVILPTPERPVLYVALNYSYDGEKGDQVDVFVLPLQGNSPPCWEFEGCSVEFHDPFSLVTGVIEPGRGTVSYVAVYYGGSEAMVTDGLRLVMMDEDGDRFYTRDVPLAVQWYPSGPDLTIVGFDPFYASDEEGYHTIGVLVRNAGYAPVRIPKLTISSGPYIPLYNQGADAPATALQGILPPMQTMEVVWPHVPSTWLDDDAEFTVDPDNAIAELNEGNNTYGGLGVRIYTVQLVEASGPAWWADGDTGLRQSQQVPFGGILGPAGQFIVRAGDRGYSLSFKGGGVSYWILDTWLYAHVVGFVIDPSCREPQNPCEIQYFDSLLGSIGTFECWGSSAGHEDWKGSHRLARDFCGGPRYNVEPGGDICSTGDECEDVADVLEYVNTTEQVIGPLSFDMVAVVAHADEDLHVSFTLWDIDSDWGNWGQKAWNTMCDVSGVIPASRLSDLPLSWPPLSDVPGAQEYEVGGPASECRVVVRIRRHQ